VPGRQRPPHVPLIIAGLLACGLAACAPGGGKPTAFAQPGPIAHAVPPPPLPDHAAGLVAATPAQVVAMLGTPSLRRIDGPAEVWLYNAAPVCRLDLVFYRDGSELHVAAASAHAAARTSEATCLKALAGTG
jgi:hypothetical protein